jgi:hypothetical protein
MSAKPFEKAPPLWPRPGRASPCFGLSAPANCLQILLIRSSDNNFVW